MITFVQQLSDVSYLWWKLVQKSSVFDLLSLLPFIHVDCGSTVQISNPNKTQEVNKLLTQRSAES